MPRIERAISLVFLFATGAMLIAFGWQGWRFSGLLPLDWVGYVVTFFGVLGLCGVNIWRNGPLDKRLDPPTDPLERGP